ncbi:MAG: 4Fe-4S binding protein [Candidatus Thermoplasmatota archaeon]
MMEGGVGRTKSRSIPSRTESRSKSTAKISKSDQSNLGSYDHPIVDKEKCIGCGVCVENCPMDAIVIKEGKAEIKSEKCSNCRKCVSACPQDAIG